MSVTTTPGKGATTHAELRERWASDETRRANGGWWSLTGFSIQATIAFERFVRRGIIEGRSDLFSFEDVSDLSEVGEKIRLIQVKRTLKKAALAAAVEEACKIVALCSPELLKKLEFQIICERDEAGLKPADLTAADVFKKDPPAPAHLKTALACFDRKEPVKVMGNPGLSLRRTLLEAGVGDPDKVARDVLGTLFDAFDGRDRAGVETALLSAMADIHAAVRKDVKSAGRILTPDLFERRPASGVTLFTGARPRLDELRDGVFLARPLRLNPLITAAEAWLSGLEDSYGRDSRKLPVLWLEGRPGDGKSILTLQLLEALVAERRRLLSIIELKDPAELSTWLETASRWISDTPNQAEIGFIDDLHYGLELDELDGLIDRAFYRGSPYVGLLTCGMRETGEVLAKTRHVEITRVTVAAPNQEDFEALRLWAEQRRGRVLPVQARADSSLSEYVVRLSSEGVDQVRRSLGVTDTLRAALAINALGLPAPRQLVDEADLSAFSAARPDIDLSPVEEGGGIRIAHAEASWPLYSDAVGDGDLEAAWGADLGRVMSFWLESQAPAAARAVLGELMNTRKVQSRLRQAGRPAQGSVLFDAARRAYEAASGQALRAPLFRQWLVATLNKRQSVRSLQEMREEGRKLLTLPIADPEVKAEVAAALLSVGARDVDRAYAAAAHHMRRAGPSVSAAKFAVATLTHGFEGETANVASAWIARNRRTAEIGDVLARVLNAKAPAELKRIAVEFVGSRLTNPISGAVLAKLATFHRDGCFYRLQDRWLQHASDPAHALAVYREQLGGSQSAAYTGRALAFMQMHPQIAGGQEVLALLLRQRGGDPDVLSSARVWLDAYPNTATATPILIDLVEVEPLAPEDLERALRHIDRGAPGGPYLADVLALVLQSADPAEQARLRGQTPPGLIPMFDKLLAKRLLRTDARLSALQNRLDRRH